MLKLKIDENLWSPESSILSQAHMGFDQAKREVYTECGKHRDTKIYKNEEF